MGLFVLTGGTFGSLFGVWLDGFLRSLGKLDLVISLCYVIFLGFVGILMFIESSHALFRRRRQTDIRRKLHQHHWLHGLPLKMRFRSEEHTSELQSLMRISYAVFCLKKQTYTSNNITTY